MISEAQVTVPKAGNGKDDMTKANLRYSSGI